jgi:hypothetical protein
MVFFFVTSGSTSAPFETWVHEPPMVHHDFHIKIKIAIYWGTPYTPDTPISIVHRLNPYFDASIFHSIISIYDLIIIYYIILFNIIYYIILYIYTWL